MFNRLIQKLFFPTPAHIGASSAYSFKQEHSQQQTPANTAHKRFSQQQAELNLDEKYATDFYHFVFGENATAAAEDELSRYISGQIQQLLATPEAILDNLPVLPASLSEIIQQINNQQFDTGVIVGLLQQEPVIAAKVIQLANSPFYNRSGKEITELKAAFMQLGVDGLSEGVINGFISRLVPQSDIYFRFYGQKMWRHSLYTGEIARQLELVHNKEFASQAYLTGLLANLGDIIIYQLMTEAFSKVHPDAKPGSGLFIQLLRQHGKNLTYFIAKHWQFPKPILDVLAMQAKLRSSSLLAVCQQQNAIACYVYEARLISELKLRHEYKKLSEDDVFTAITCLLHSDAAKDYLSHLFTYQWQMQA